MQKPIPLVYLLTLIQQMMQQHFDDEVFWVKARVMNVKKYERNRRCYLTLEDNDNGVKTAEVKAVFWSTTYHEIEKFEQVTKQPFKDGIEINCKVRVRFHPIYGLNLDVLQIDVAHTIGTLELERQQTLARLLKENPQTIQWYDDRYRTFNNRLELPLVIKHIALITAPNSDGQRDFLQELRLNKYGFQFQVTAFLTTIQGDQAHLAIAEQLQLIEQSERTFDAIAIVRGGGAQTDFKPFEDYELAKAVANFPIPIFTGIGHDRNQSIVDLMARELKTPTKVAALFIEHNFEFENELIDLKRRMHDAVQEQLKRAKEALSYAKRMVKLASLQSILDRGFAIVMKGNKIMVNPDELHLADELHIRLKNETLVTSLTKKIHHEKPFEL